MPVLHLQILVIYQFRCDILMQFITSPASNALFKLYNAFNILSAALVFNFNFADAIKSSHCIVSVSAFTLLLSICDLINWLIHQFLIHFDDLNAIDDLLHRNRSFSAMNILCFVLIINKCVYYFFFFFLKYIFYLIYIFVSLCYSLAIYVFCCYLFFFFVFMCLNLF